MPVGQTIEQRKSSMKPHKILVIDDSRLQRKLIKEVLEHSTKFSCVVTEAEDGIQGLSSAAQLKPDVILCDINMPQMDGYKFIEMFRQNTLISHVPIVMITSVSTRDALRKAMGSGADDYLTKPFTDDELVDAVAVQLNKIAKQADQVKRNLDSLRKSVMTAMPHELRTPLTSILTGSELLIAHSDRISPEKAQDILKNIHRGAKRLGSTITRYLELIDLRMHAQVQACPPFAFNQEWLTLVLNDPLTAQVLQTAVTQTESTATPGTHLERLEIDIDPVDLPCDQTDLIRILHELIGNALRFSHPETVVKIRGNSTPSGYALNISNQGNPLPDQFAALGGDFMQFGREDMEQQGMGLGLSMAMALLARNQAYLQWWQIDGDPNLLQMVWPQTAANTRTP